VLEPSCTVARSVLRRFRRRVPPVICLSIYPRESVDVPEETVAYLQKPTSTARLGAVLTDVART
jgi:superfamily II DNA or RNA helicase